MEETAKSEILRVYANVLSVRTTAILTGWSRPTVKSVVCSSGAAPVQRKYAVNADAFIGLDTPDKAYWLGFLLADGTINFRKGTSYPKWLSISLQYRDTSHVDKLKEFLAYSGPTVTVHSLDKRSMHVSKQTRLTVCSSHLCRSLVSIGWIQFKTFGDTNILDAVKPDVVPDLMRGMLDGDGGFIMTRMGQILIYFVSRHRSVAEWFQKKMVSMFGFGPTKLWEGKASEVYRVQYRGNVQAKRFLGSIYQGTPRLDRKFDLFTSFT